MMLRWGTEIADNLGLKCFVQGSRVGRPVYERHGFVDEKGWITVPVSDEHKNQPAIGWFNLTRPATHHKIPEASNTA